MTNEGKSGFAARLRARRIEMGLSQGDLAGDDFSSSYVSLLESGRRDATAHVLEVMSVRLGTSIEYLATGVAPETRREVELGLRYAELALQNSEAAVALEQFTAVIAQGEAMPELAAEAQWGQARALETLGRLEEAMAAYDEIRLADLGDPARASRWAECVIALCRCSVETGDLGRAVELGEYALVHMAGLGLEGTDLQAQVTSSLLFAYFQRGDLVRAQLLADGLVRSVDAQASRVARGSAYWNASLVAESRGRLAEALDLAERALAMFAESDGRRSIARLRIAYAWLLLRLAEPPLDRAEQQLRQARAELVDTGTAVDLAYCDTELARIALLRDDLDAAVETARQVIGVLGEDHMESGRVLLVLGQALYRRGDRAEAREVMRRASAALIDAGSPRQAAAALRESGDLLKEDGDVTAASDAYRRALALMGVDGAPLPSVAQMTAPATLAARR